MRDFPYMRACGCKRHKSKNLRTFYPFDNILRSVMISAASTRNTILFVVLFIYFIILLIVSRYEYQIGDEDGPYTNSINLIIVDSFLLMGTTVALIMSWTAPQVLERSSVLITSFLFALLFCWLVIATPAADIYAGFFAINVIIAIGLLTLDLWTFYRNGKGFVTFVLTGKASGSGNAAMKKGASAEGISKLGDNKSDYDQVNKVDRVLSLEEGDSRTSADGSFASTVGTTDNFGKHAGGTSSSSNTDTDTRSGVAAILMEAKAREHEEMNSLYDASGLNGISAEDDIESRRRSSTSSTHSISNINNPNRSSNSSSSSAASSTAKVGGKTLIGYMQRDVDLTRKGMCEGFRVNMHMLPNIKPVGGNKLIPKDLVWESFSEVTHLVDSSSCHIYTALWGGTVPVILKLIKEERVQSTVALAEFDTEENVLSRVQHPNIVRLLGSGTQPRKFLVLELLSGGTLSHSLGVRSDIAKQQMWLKKFSMLETLKLAHALAKALSYLHNEWSNVAHIIHRDIKPDNIGWSSDGVLKLFDFGLCATVRRQRERTEQYRLTGNTGTLRYMAPEVVLGRSYHKSVDTYSFAIMIWQVAAGKIPFREMGKKMYFDRVVIGGHRPKLDPRWPSGFSDLLIACWHEDKNARPDFSEVVAELEQLIQDEELLFERRNNRCWLKAAEKLGHLIMVSRPVLLLLSLMLLGIAFGLAARDGADAAAGSGASIAFFAALGSYALIMSYLQVWPLVTFASLATKQRQQQIQLQQFPSQQQEQQLQQQHQKQQLHQKAQQASRQHQHQQHNPSFGSHGNVEQRGRVTNPSAAAVTAASSVKDTERHGGNFSVESSSKVPSLGVSIDNYASSGISNRGSLSTAGAGVGIAESSATQQDHVQLQQFDINRITGANKGSSSSTNTTTASVVAVDAIGEVAFNPLNKTA